MVKLYSILEKPQVYRVFQQASGGVNARKAFFKDFRISGRNKRILDIGCGVGEVLSFLEGPYRYTGFDGNPSYIAYAAKRFPDSRFYCSFVSESSLEPGQKFDLVMALGIIHHLTDEDSGILLRIAKNALDAGGTFVAFDSIFTQNQSAVSKFFVGKDRGKFIRDESTYLDLIGSEFKNVRSKIFSKEFYLPYTAIGIVAENA